MFTKYNKCAMEPMKEYRRVICMLKSVYSEVQGIESFLETIGWRETREGKVPGLISSSDSVKYKRFISEIIVCTTQDVKLLSQPVNFQQLSSQREVVARVIQKLCEKGKKNVLSSGYACISENSSQFVKFAPNICIFQLNQTTFTIGASPLWETLLSRIGDDVMMHLLQRCALFMLAPPSSCYQICGVPVYNLVSSGVVFSFRCTQQKSLNAKFNVLSKFVKLQRSFYKRYQQKVYQWKQRSAVGRQSHYNLRSSASLQRKWTNKIMKASQQKKRRLGKGVVPPAKRVRSDSCNISLLVDNRKGAKSCQPSIHPKKEKKKVPFKAPSVNFSSVYIERRHMFYSSQVLKKSFYNSFGMSWQKDFKVDEKRLIETIFLQRGLFGGNDAKRRPDNYWRKRMLPKRYHQMRKVFKQLVKRHGTCRYIELLKKYCPCPFNPAKTQESSHQGSTLEKLLQQHSHPWKVYMFVRECLHYVVPQELWGSNHNKCRFLTNVKKFIFLGKFCRFSLSDLMWNMRLNHCDWLEIKNEKKKRIHFYSEEHRLREVILAKFLYWLMGTYVVQLLKSFFYITEAVKGKNTLHFYRQYVWELLQDIGVRKHLEKTQLQPLTTEEIAEMQRQNKDLMISTLRLIPKRNGLRPIVKVGKTMGMHKQIQQTNEKKLKLLCAVLNYEWKRNPSLIGSSVFGMDGVYKVLKQFAQERKKHMQDLPHYYFVKADVTGAFDTLPHDKLLDVVSGIIHPDIEESYCIRHYAEIWSDPVRQIRKSFKTDAYTMMDLLPNMKMFASQLQKEKSLRSAILVEQGMSINEPSKKLLAFFKQMLKSNVIKIENKTYLQRCGIPQGCIVSTLLCCLCYGDMENKLLSGVQQDGVLLRWVDDFLLITPHLSNAKQFLRTLAAGIPEYGCIISPHKTAVNFPVDDIPGCAEAKQLPGVCMFPWCGLLLDTRTAEVFCDYGSFSGTSIRSSLTLGSSPCVGKKMRNKLLAILRLKAHAIFLDLELNSQKTVCINIYKIFLLQAYRFYACVLNLPFGQRVRNNPCFFLSVISQMATSFYSTLKIKNKGTRLGAKDASGIVPFEAVQWLCYRAFIVKLSRHKCTSKCLSGPLKTSNKKLQRKLPKEMFELLKQITDPALPPDIARIRD
ncbi:telomerase reverse transcriptase [Acipenser ruthenus]|uniref:telomerase reverse transcriptase n=1 Tax=Acipenser ruthenus TaxID=7906 RepID=UPI0027409988|nr:telomerase reverse transcriptase [Acipenser ruthenus]